MKNNKFSFPKMSEFDFSISYVDIENSARINQNESHIHKECEIYINLEGDVSFEVENKIYPITRGSVIITRPFEYHHCIYHSNKKHTHYWITFSADNDECLKMFFNREKGTDNLIILEESVLKTVCEFMDILLDKKSSLIKKRIAFLQTIYIFNNEKPLDFCYSTPQFSNILIKALEYMDENLENEIDLKLLCRKCNTSPSTLHRLFKKSLGASPIIILRKKRLIASMVHLRNGSKVCDAAMLCGFTDYSNYIQHFKAQFGMTPLQYKKKFN